MPAPKKALLFVVGYFVVIFGGPAFVLTLLWLFSYSRLPDFSKVDAPELLRECQWLLEERAKAGGGPFELDWARLPEIKKLQCTLSIEPEEHRVILGWPVRVGLVCRLDKATGEWVVERTGDCNHLVLYRVKAADR